MSPWKPKDFSKMLKNIKISTPKNIEIYILFLGHWTPAVLHHFLETEHFLREFHQKNCWNFHNLYNIAGILQKNDHTNPKP